MGKNIVLCLDGTNNQYGPRNTNVVHLYELLDKDDPDEQVVYYDPGVGTFSPSPVLTKTAGRVMKWLGLAFGLGLTTNLKEAYRFLMDTYEPDDHIYVFGFSRGAYTARVLVALIRMCGLLRRGHHNLLDYAIQLHAERDFNTALGDLDRPTPANAPLKGFKATFSQECHVHFLGLWDTVSSVGWVWNPRSYAYTATPQIARHVRHAVSIDERRAFFRQNVFKVPDPTDGPADILEIWFAGVHSDIGGSYPEGENHLARLTLEWLLIQARRTGLLFDEQAAIHAVHTDPPLDSDAFTVHKSLNWKWLWAEIVPKLPYAGKKKLRLPRLNLGRRRRPRHPATLHETAVLKGQQDTDYPVEISSKPPPADWERLSTVVTTEPSPHTGSSSGSPPSATSPASSV